MATINGIGRFVATIKDKTVMLEALGSVLRDSGPWPILASPLLTQYVRHKNLHQSGWKLAATRVWKKPWMCVWPRANWKERKQWLNQEQPSAVLRVSLTPNHL